MTQIIGILDMNWTLKQPTRPGKYKMRDAKGEYIVYVEKNGPGLSFHKKGENDRFSFNGTEGCEWAKCR